MADGYIDTWLERIILPPIPLQETPSVEQAPEPSALAAGAAEVVVAGRTA